jgi:hypothetical protein
MKVSADIQYFQWVPLVEQELFTLLHYLRSPVVFSGFESLVFCVMFCRSLFFFLVFVAVMQLNPGISQKDTYV